MHSPELAKKLRQRINALELERANFDNLYDEISDLVVPQRAKVRGKQAPGQDRTRRALDGTAADAVSLSSAAAHGAITPSSMVWVYPQLDREFMGLEGVRDWLNACAEVMFISMHGSNFDSESMECWMDLLAYNTACFMTLEDEEDDIRFMSFQPGFFSIDEDERGIVNTVVRKFELSHAAAVSQFGLENVSEKCRKCVLGNKPYERAEYRHFVFPSKQWPEGIPDKAPRKEYASIYFEMSNTGGHVVSIGGFSEFPYSVPRWHKASGEKYGRGPGINTLPDVRTLNQRIYNQLVAEAKVADPPMAIHDRAAVGDICFDPGSLNVFRPKFGTTPIFPIYQHMGQAVQFTEIGIDKQREIVSRRFLLDQIQFPPMAGTPVSATEITARMEMMQRILGPVYGRILREWHQIMLFRVFRILLRKGRFPQPPPALEQEGVANLRFRFVNPVTQAQAAADVTALTQAMSTLAAFSDRHPEIEDFLDYGKAGERILRGQRVPEDVIREDNEVEELRKGREQAQAQMAQEQQDLSAAQAVGAAAPGVEVFQGGR